MTKAPSVEKRERIVLEIMNAWGGRVTPHRLKKQARLSGLPVYEVDSAKSDLQKKGLISFDWIAKEWVLTDHK